MQRAGALLAWSKRQAETRNISVIDIRLGEFGGAENETHKHPGLSRWLRAVSGFSILGMGVDWREVSPSKAVTAIERRARRKPVLVTIDEAHTLPLKLGRALLSAGQRWQYSGLPAMLLLAGTPGLPEHLNTMGTTFWERSEELPIGRL